MSDSKEEQLLHYACANGIVMAAKRSITDSNQSNSNSSSILVCHAPFTVEPYPFPREAFATALAAGPLFNVLVDRIARDSQWLCKALKNTAESDPFTGRLLAMYKEVLGSGAELQPFALGVLRSDYMLNCKQGDARLLLQVEINTIASSFGSISTRIADMYRLFDSKERIYNVPANTALDDITDGIASAHSIFNQQQGASDDSSVVIMVVQENERNFADQRILHFNLLARSNGSIRMHRATLSELGADVNNANSSGTYFNRSTRTYYFRGEAVSVFYFRSGYTPSDFPGETEWAARRDVELCSAIKCPTLGYHLAGCKKIQQLLATDGVLERFVAAPDAASLRRVFARQYNLDVHEESSGSSSSVGQAIEAAILSPSDFVLKPQREGGGNNLYDDELVDALRAMSDSDRAAFILMEKIRPSSCRARMLRDGVVTEAEAICELGVYGVFIGDGSAGSYTLEPASSATTPSRGAFTTYNKHGGFLLRVKSAQSNEGGVAAGYAVLSSPTLV